MTVADDDRVLLKCFAGCEVAAVVHAVGLDMQDLFQGAHQRTATHPRRARTGNL